MTAKLNPSEIWKALLWPLLAIAPVIALTDCSEVYSHQDWLFEVEEKKFTYAQSVTEPKILFVAGSNLMFGFDGNVLSRELDVPVVNYGLHAGIGADMIAARAAQMVNANDVIVYAPEWGNLRPDNQTSSIRSSWFARFDLKDPELSSLDQTMYRVRTRWRRAKQCWLGMRLRWMINHRRMQSLSRDVQLAAWVRVAQNGEEREDNIDVEERVEKAEVDSVYSVRSFDERGNLTKRPAGARVDPSAWQRSVPPPSIDLEKSRAVWGLRVLAEAAAAKDATLLVMTPIRLSRPDWGWTRPVVDVMESAWLNRVRDLGIDVLLTDEQTTLDQKYGLNTMYHLDTEGSEIMTERLAEALRPYSRRMQLH